MLKLTPAMAHLRWHTSNPQEAPKCPEALIHFTHFIECPSAMWGGGLNTPMSLWHWGCRPCGDNETTPTPFRSPWFVSQCEFLTPLSTSAVSLDGFPERILAIPRTETQRIRQRERQCTTIPCPTDGDSLEP